jgi:polysaccharide export outer membrane protein
MRAIICLLALALTTVLHSQAPPQGGEPAGRAPSTAAVMVGSDYVLRAGDVVTVTVFQEPDLACSERVAADGTIDVPLAGRINVAGKTALSASNSVKAALEDGFLVNAQVTLGVTDATKQYFTLLGQVASPGAYALPASGRISLLQAIGLAGGFTRLASPGRITVKRVLGGKDELIKVDADKLASGKGTGGFDVLPGDVITVKERIF